MFVEKGLAKKKNWKLERDRQRLDSIKHESNMFVNFPVSYKPLRRPIISDKMHMTDCSYLENIS